METQNNNIDKHFRKLSEETQPKDFQNMENIWNKVEKKLDEKDKKHIIPLWKYAGIAASLLLLIGLGSRFIGNDPVNNIIQQPEQHIVTVDDEEIREELNTISDTDVVVAEDKKSEKEDTVVSVSPVIESIEISSDEIEVEKAEIADAEIAVSDIQTESLVAVEESELEVVTDTLVKVDSVSESGFAVTEEYNQTVHKAIADKIYERENVERTITGTVTDEYGLPLPGVHIIIKNTLTGAQTDFDGNYAINASVGEILVFSYVGYTTIERLVTETTKTIYVQFQAREELQQVVVTGFAVAREKRALGYAVSEISVTDDTEQRYNSNINRTLSGKTSGVIINNTSGISDTESYESFIENQFEGTSYNPVSTFSIDVDNASYTNIRRFINNGQKVPKDAVRIEEMINFFKYDYPQPRSEHPFSIHTEYSDAPWNPNHKLLKIGLQGKDIPTDKLPKSNFVFLVDVSGSMNAPNKLPLLKSSMKILLDELRDDDRVSIVYYANNVGVLLEPTKASEKQKIIDVIDKMYASGGTSGGAGIELAYQMAEKHFIKGGNNRIILATDGDFNIGRSSDKEMQELIEEKRKSGIFLTCLGFGMGNYKDSKMEILANKGNGNYAYIDNIQEANRFLGKEFKGSMFTIAKDVKIQIEFNPNHVQAYRLIGYENRKLRNEDFTNDAIDAGELGSGHTVTALYEIIPVGVKSDFYENNLDLKYTKTNTVSNDFQNELATVKFRYKKPDGEKSTEMVHPISKNPVSLSAASKDFKFTSAVAWFGLKLRDSKLVPNKETKGILKLAREGINNDTDGYKAEFIRLVESVRY